MITAEGELDPAFIQKRKESVLENDINQTINQLYGTVFPMSQLPEPLIPTSTVYPMSQLPEPLIPTKYEPEEKEAVVSPPLKDRIAVFSVEKIENIPNQIAPERKGSVEQKHSPERPKIEAKKPSVKGVAPQPVVTQSSFDQQTPSRENSQKTNENVKTGISNIEARKVSFKGGSHTVTVNNQTSFDQQVPSRESSVKNSGSVKAPEPPKQIISTQVDGKHKTVLTIGGPSKVPATSSKSVPLPAPIQPTAKAKTLPANTHGALKNSQSLTLNSGAEVYSYAQANQDGQARNQTGSAGNSQFYSFAAANSGDATLATPQTGSQTVYSYSVVDKGDNKTDTNLYSEVDKSKISRTSQNGPSNDVYDPVHFSEVSSV